MPLAEFFQDPFCRPFEQDVRDFDYSANGVEIIAIKPVFIPRPDVFLIRWIDPGTDTKGSLRPESVDLQATDEDGANDIMAIQQKLHPERIYWVAKNPEYESRIIKP
jgi:hypothetical protein